MKPISYVYSYINLPKNEWNDLDVDIWLYNALKSLHIGLKQQNTKLVKIEDYEACICDEYEAIQAVVVRTDEAAQKDYEVVDGNIIVPATDYPIVQQTLNDQIYAIYPLLPVWFPNNNSKVMDITWSWAKPRKVIFEKQCKDCPTYCNDCEYVYDMKLDGCLYFPQIEKGLACINYLTFPKLEEFMIDDKNQPLIDALAAYVEMHFYDMKRKIDYTQQNEKIYQEAKQSWIGFKRSAQNFDMVKSLNINKVSNIMNDKVYKMLRTIQR